jgi:hypothetical protein
MEDAINEIAMSGFRSKSTDNIALWVLIAIVFLGFSRGGQGLGFGNLFGAGCCPDPCEDPCRRRSSKKCKRSSSSRCCNNNNGLNGLGFLGKGGNLWFILIIIGILFLLSDGFGGSNTNIVNVATEGEGEDC